MTSEREMFLIHQKVNRLFSFYYHADGGFAEQDFLLWKQEIKNENILRE